VAYVADVAPERERSPWRGLVLAVAAGLLIGVVVVAGVVGLRGSREVPPSLDGSAPSSSPVRDEFAIFDRVATAADEPPARDGYDATAVQPGTMRHAGERDGWSFWIARAAPDQGVGSNAVCLFVTFGTEGGFSSCGGPPVQAEIQGMTATIVPDGWVVPSSAHRVSENVYVGPIDITTLTAP
jgi:hypothetical protein